METLERSAPPKPQPRKASPINAEYEDKAKLLCHLSALEWSHLIKNKTRSVILDLAETGGSEAVARYLYNVIHKHKVGAVNGDWFAIFYSEFMARQSEPPS